MRIDIVKLVFVVTPLFVASLEICLKLKKFLKKDSSIKFKTQTQYLYFVHLKGFYIHLKSVQ